MSIYEKLMKIQSELVAPKNQRNNFGNYNFRSNEDILEAVKPLLKEIKAVIVQTDDIINIGNRYYIKATSEIVCSETGDKTGNTAFAREAETKKGMDESQITGSASSYARKYSLNGLLSIDDSKDDDTRDQRPETTAPAKPAPKAATPARPAAPAKPAAPKQEPATTIEKRGTGLIEAVSTKTGTKKNGQHWTRYGVKINGVFYGTFSETLGTHCQELQGSEVDFVYTTDGKYEELVAVEPIIQINQDTAQPAADDGCPF
jgi:hypothetical protein